MDQTQYQSYFRPSESKPDTVIDQSQSLDRQQQLIQQEQQKQQNYLAENNRRIEKEAAKTGSDLKALSKFSKTLTETLTQNYKQTQEDIKIGEMYDALLGGYDPESPQAQSEQQSLDSQREEASLVDQAVAEVEQNTNSPIAAEMVRNDLGGNARGYRGQLGDVTMARSAYAGYMQGYINGDGKININGRDMSLAEVRASGDARLINAAIAQGRRQFIKDFGLQNATKTMVVKTLMGTMLQTDASLSTSIALAGVKQNRTDAANSILNTFSVELSSIPESDYSSAILDATDRSFGTGAYTTREQAQQAVVGAAFNAAANQSVDAVDALAGTLKIPGQAGTEFGSQYYSQYQAAREQAVRNEDRKEKEQVKTLTQNYYQAVGDPDLTPEQRRQINSDYATQLEELGLHQQARAIRERVGVDMTDPGSAALVFQIQQHIEDGTISSVQEIRDFRDAGDITKEQATYLEQSLVSSQGSETALSESVKNTHGDWKTQIKDQVAASTGNSVDTTGTIFSGKNPPVSGGEANRIANAAERELLAILNTFEQQNPQLRGAALQAALQDRANQWWTSQFQTEGGKYYAITQLQGETNKDRIKELSGQIKGLAYNAQALAMPSPTAILDAELPQDHTSITSSPGGWTRSMRPSFKPSRGDRVFSIDQINSYRDQYDTDGTFSEELVQTATALGMSPMNLMAHQSGVHRLPPIQLRSTTPPPTGSNPTAVQGKQQIMSLGFPDKGASWISGNIQTESSWNGQRDWGQVQGDGSDRNGGLISWSNQIARNVYRLDEIERYLGKPIDQATDEEQLRAMKWEMSTKYPNAYRIFMNPYSTPRQLMDASIEYWGYGTEGDRYVTARQLETQP